MKSYTILFALLCSIAIRLYAAAPPCPEVGTIRITECNNTTIETLSRQKSMCDPALRIIHFISWLDSLAKPCSTIVKSAKERYAFYRDTTRFSIVYPEMPLAGAPNAPVRITVYISMSCPLCKKICHDLSDSIQGKRARQMAIFVKPVSTTQLEHALIAVQKLRKEAELFRAIAPLKQRLTSQTLLRIVDSIGIDLQQFTPLMFDTGTVAWVDSSRAEAIRNGVTSTPTLFINGRPYPVYKTARWVIDAAEFELTKTHSP